MAFTAAAALDVATPRILRIAGDQISGRELATVVEELTKSKFELVRAGSLEDLAALIKRFLAADPESEKAVFPSWQGMQYMHNMFSGRAKLEPLDNDRYPNIQWTSAREVIVCAAPRKLKFMIMHLRETIVQKACTALVKIRSPWAFPDATGACARPTWVVPGLDASLGVWHQAEDAAGGVADARDGPVLLTIGVGGIILSWRGILAWRT